VGFRAGRLVGAVNVKKYYGRPLTFVNRQHVVRC
jgi:hypothetical protein